jgi:mannosyltransferase OCH1-like enzyme
MIELDFGLFHSGGKMSYLRYLTFKSLRHYHPDSSIKLYVSEKCKTDGYQWGREKQDFENQEDDSKDYVEDLECLNVEVIRADLFENYAPNYQSDFFRWWYLQNFGGFYLDTDQIIVRSFEGLPLDNELIFCKYINPQCGEYTPVGVIGAEKDSPIVSRIVADLPSHYNPYDYNSLGPFMFNKIIQNPEVNLVRAWNADYKVFYPTLNSDGAALLYQPGFKMPDNTLSSHWFGGHPLSQDFNKRYTEEFAQESDDSISTFLREEGII